MGGAAEKWRPGRGRRPGWGTHAGGVDGGASCGRGPGGSGGPGSSRRAAAAAPSAPPGTSGLGLRLRDPDASRSSLRLCSSSSWRRCRRRCCSCCHNPRPGPGRRQRRARPRPQLHPRGGVARPRRARRAGRQRGQSSQARARRSRPHRRHPRAAAATADSALTLIPRGAPAPGGASFPTPSPSHWGSWPGRPPPRRPCFVWWPRHHRCPGTSQIRGEARRPVAPNSEKEPPREATGSRPVPALLGRASLARQPRDALENPLVARPPTLGMPPLRTICTFFLQSGVPLFNLSLHPSWQAFSSAESCCPGFLRRFKPFLQLGIYLFLNSSV